MGADLLTTLGRPDTRARLLLGALACVAIAAAPARAAAEDVSLDLVPHTARYGSTVRLGGAVTPSRRAEVQIFRSVSGSWRLVTGGLAHADGTYSFRIPARRPALYVARTDAAESPERQLHVRPLVQASFAGPAVLGAPLRVKGRLQPVSAGTLTLRARDRTRTVHVGRRGHFTLPLPTGRAGRLGIRLALHPTDGYATVRRRLATRVGTPSLRVGSHGAAVHFLERRLKHLRYVLRGVGRRFHADTRDAVYAFQKVEGLRRDGVAGPPVWRKLKRARTPAAAVARGNHIEIDKARQVLFEVRHGRVAHITHVSTGATGNTPVGRWRIYLKTPGFNSLGMYYSMYFLRGFAVHGYHSVPPWPASHGCARLPLWFARRIYSRWQVGSVVWVFSTTARRSARWQPPADVRRAVAPADSGPVGP